MLFYLPVLIVVCANIIYDISSKSIPEKLNCYAAVTITYAVLACFNFLLFLVLNPDDSILLEMSRINWAVLVFALMSVGLECGYIYLFRAGWNISVGSVVCNICLAVCMVLVGFLVFHETITLKQLAGVVLCVCGLFFINRGEFREASGKEDPDEISV